MRYRTNLLFATLLLIVFLLSLTSCGHFGGVVNTPNNKKEKKEQVSTTNTSDAPCKPEEHTL